MSERAAPSWEETGEVHSYLWTAFSMVLAEVSTKAGYIERCLRQVTPAPPKDANEIFFWLETAVFHAGTISLMFSPGNNVHKDETPKDAPTPQAGKKAVRKFRKERKKLIETFFAREKKSIDYLIDRKLRNQLSHIDVQYDSMISFAFSRRGKTVALGQRVVGERSSVLSTRQEVDRTLEYFIPSEQVFGVLGDEIHVPTLLSHATALRNRAEMVHDSHFFRATVSQRPTALGRSDP